MKKSIGRRFKVILSLISLLLFCSGCYSLNTVSVGDEYAKEDALSAPLNDDALSDEKAEDENLLPEDFEYQYGAGVFSWDHLADDIDTRCLIDNNISEIYQYIDDDYTDEEVEQFLFRMESSNIDVYFLAGEAEWSYKENYAGMEHVLERAVYFNEKHESLKKIQGIVYDVEPYLLDKWHNIPDQLLEEYCDNVKNISAEGREYGLSIYVCVPYSYDLMGRDHVLRDLIDNSDGIFVLNYNKGHEIDNIRREASLARGYKKRIVNVYELRPGLLSQTADTVTYYNDGLLSVQLNYLELLSAYPSTEIGIAYHSLEYLRVLSIKNNQ